MINKSSQLIRAGWKVCTPQKLEATKMLEDVLLDHATKIVFVIVSTIASTYCTLQTVKDFFQLTYVWLMLRLIC